MGDDIFVEPGFLMQHMDVHNQNPGEEVVCLGFTTWDPKVEINAYMRFLETSGWQFAYNRLNKGFIKHPEPFKFFYTSNISVKKSIFEPFNEEFKEYGWEDIELGYRLWKKRGMRLYYEPEAKAFHHHKIPESSLAQRMKTVGHTALLFEKVEPEVNVIPKGAKAILIRISTLLPFIILSRILGKKLYFKLLSWRFFFKGVKEGQKA